MSDCCPICNEPHTNKNRNTAIFDCGHAAHLSCVLEQTKFHMYGCPACNEKETVALKPNLGADRNIAIESVHAARVRERQLYPPQRPGIGRRLLNIISPLTPVSTTMGEHVANQTTLQRMKQLGFTAADAVNDRIPWSTLQYNYTPADLIQFGFTWDQMVTLGIEPQHINAFTWQELRSNLDLDAQKLMKLNLTISEMSKLSFSCAQYHELGFNWALLNRLGANVETMRPLNWSLQDIKTYWSPSVSQWIQAGFYDRKRLTAAGWPIEDARTALPSLTQGKKGRAIRLAF